MSDAFCRAVRPPSDLQVADWCAQNVHIVGSERSSKFDIDQFPWWRFPMEQIRNHDVQEVYVTMPTGSGKSTMAEALFCYIVSEDAGNLLYASQANDKAKFWAESRLLPALKKCKSLETLWPEDRHSSRKTEIIWPHMAMQFVGANLTNFQEVSVRYVFGDEDWRWDDGLIKEALARHHERWNRKAFFVSQGGYKHKEGFRKREIATEYIYKWACQGCGNYHDWSDANLKYDIVKKDGELDRQATCDTARIQCPNCGHVHKDSIQDRRALCDSSTYILERIGSNPRMVYIHGVTRLTMWWVSYSEVVGRILDAKDQLNNGRIEPWKQLRQKDFAEFWDENFVPDKKEIAIGDFSKEELSAMTIENEHGRYMTIDCGKGHYWHIAAAWTKYAKCKVLSEGYIDSEAKLKAVQDKAGIAASNVFVDISWDTENLDVLAMIERNGWTGIRGSDKLEFTHQTQDGKQVAKAYSKYGRMMTKSKQIVRYFFVSSKRFKDDTDGLLNAGRIELPLDVSDNFRNHLKAEVRAETTDAKGNVTQFWKTLNRNNHLWDCLYYNVAVAYVRGVFKGE
jgi:phage terminase large subunit GpA-like protein